VEQHTPATAPVAAPGQAPDNGQPVDAGRVPAGPPGFSARGRVRRRARFLRKARELAYRDLGGLVFNLHRFGERNDALVLAKLATLGNIDTELRTLETALRERQPVTVLREAGITACPRCAAIHSGEDRFCPNCGLSMSRHVDLPIAGAASPPPPPAAAPGPASAPASPTARPPATPSTPARGSSSAPAAATAPRPAGSPPAPAPAPASAPPAAPAVDQPTEIVRPPGADA
jgi:hypothetical protein